MAAFLNMLLWLNKFDSFKRHSWSTKSNITFTLHEPTALLFNEYHRIQNNFNNMPRISYPHPYMRPHAHLRPGQSRMPPWHALAYLRGQLSMQCSRNWNKFLYHAFLLEPVDQVFNLTYMYCSMWLQFNCFIKILETLMCPALVKTIFFVISAI